jgi:XapX domain-containing protein
MLYLISFGAGLVVGLLYWLVRVQSPAPPLIALAGLLGIVMGEASVPFVQAQFWHSASHAWAAPAVVEPESARASDSRNKT